MTPSHATHPGGTATLADRKVARIGYGAMQLAERPAGAVDPQAAIALLRHATDRGVDHIDTAQFYGDATANQLIRAALHPYPEHLALVSKVGAGRDRNGALVPSQRPEQLRADVEANLRSLRTDRIAVVNLRRLDSPPGILAEGDQRVDLDSQLAELIALRDEGKIEGIGLSNVSAEQLRRALPAGIACVQNAYSVLDRAAEPVLDLCRAHDIAWVPFFPLGSGFAGHPKVGDHPEVRAAADALGAAPAQVGLAWLLAHDPHTLLIPGTADLAHLDENLGAGDLRLPDELKVRLDRLS